MGPPFMDSAVMQAESMAVRKSPAWAVGEPTWSKTTSYMFKLEGQAYPTGSSFVLTPLVGSTENNPSGKPLQCGVRSGWKCPAWLYPASPVGYPERRAAEQAKTTNQPGQAPSSIR